MAKTIKKIESIYKYLTRSTRAWLMRLFLKSLIPFFALEERIHPPENHKGKRILIAVFGGLGDCLLFDTLFRRVKEQYPDAQIDVLTACFEEMWERIASIDRLIYFKPFGFKPPWKYARLFRTIYRNHYDIAAEGIAMISLGGIYPIFTSLVFEASRAPIRIGRPNTGFLPGLYSRNSIFGFCDTRMLPPSQKKRRPQTERKNPYLTHVIELVPPEERDYHESAKVFEPLNMPFYRNKTEPVLAALPEKDQWARDYLRSRWAGETDIIVGFTIETTRMIKSWPVINFLNILEWGIEDRLKFVMLGLHKNDPHSPFKDFPDENLLDLTGETTLGEMIALISNCDVFLACDTGPAHIAQACRVPTIVLFGPSNELEFGPFDLDFHTLILPPDTNGCRPCALGPCFMDQSCICRIEPETVYQEIETTIHRLNEDDRRFKRKPHRPPAVICTI